MKHEWIQSPDKYYIFDKAIDIYDYDFRCAIRYTCNRCGLEIDIREDKDPTTELLKADVSFFDCDNVIIDSVHNS